MKRGWWPWLALGICTAWVFRDVLSHGFFNFDDYENFVDNPMVHGLGWANIAWMLTSLHMTTYQPLAWLAGGAVFSVVGPWAPAFHGLSLGLHAANAAMLGLLLWRVLRRAAPGSPSAPSLAAALAAGLLWAVHPTRVAAVAWATKVSDLMSAFFFLSACLAYVGPGPGKPGVWKAAGFFLASGLSRWTGITLPMVLLLLDVFPLKRLDPHPRTWFKAPGFLVWVEKWPFLAAAVGLGLVNAWAKAQIGGISLLHGLWQPVDSCLASVFYLRKLLFPADLGVLYAIVVPGRPAALAAASAVLLVLAVTAGLLAFRRAAALCLAGWLLWLAGLLPTFAASSDGTVFGQDSYTYIPSMGLALILAQAFQTVFEKSWPRTAARWASVLAVVLACAGLAAWSAKQTAVWREPQAVWRQTVAAEPRLWIAHVNLGSLLLEQGRWDEARLHYAQALRLRPGAPEWKAQISEALRQMPSSAPDPRALPEQEAR
ncbi:MAG: tetratricopeptide repeat protein [Elusimicrobia bacterium]|nr:tetratricopeptide repeat protein [Elusimicrobiota bacterium]